MLAPNPFDLMAQPPDHSKNNSRTVSAARSPKKIPDKCIRCALLSMEEVRSLHGATGDNCYVSEVCRSRRSHARHHYQRNQTRKQKWHEIKVGVDGNPSDTQTTAQLIIYRAVRYNAPIDGIAAILRQGKTKLAVVQPIYCAGLLPKQIDTCIATMLMVLQQDYGITKFTGVVQQLPRLWEEPGRLERPLPRYPELQVDVPGITDCYSAVLEVCRESKTSAVIALKTEVWKGSTPESGTPLLDCRGLMPSQIHVYLGQVLALLELRYRIRWFAGWVELPLESCLPLLVQTEQTIEAEPEPEVTLDLDPMWQELEISLQQPELLPVEALAVAAEGISQIVLQFTQFAELAFEELEAFAERGVMLPEDAFDLYIRQTMEVDFEQFVEPRVSLPRKSLKRQELVEGDSVVGELNRAAVLQVLDEQMSQEPELTEVEIFNQALALSHDEDVSAWAGAIAHWMQQHRSSLPMMELVRAVQMPLLNVWLGVLLSDEFVVEQRGQFYDLSGVWISMS